MPWIAAGAGLLGSVLGGGASGTPKWMKQAAQSNPFSFQGAGGGGVNFQGHTGTATESPEMAQFRQLIGQGGANALQGGLFNNPGLQRALGGADITGGMQNQNALLSQMMGNTAFGGLGGLAGNAGGLNNMFSQSLQGGQQDLSGGLMGRLNQAGMGNLAQAGNTSGLVQQNLDASRALAQPFENQLVNRFQNNEFMGTRGATSGAAERQGQLQSALLGADQQRIMGAQQLGLQNQQQLGNIGLGQLGQGGQLSGQNIQGFGQQLQGFGQAGQLGLGAEGMGFGQMLQGLQQNQTAGQQRLKNAMGLFGLGVDTQQGQFQQGLNAQGAGINQDSMNMQQMLGLLNADAARIGGAGLSTNGFAQMQTNQQAQQGGMLQGVIDAFSGPKPGVGAGMGGFSTPNSLSGGGGFNPFAGVNMGNFSGVGGGGIGMGGFGNFTPFTPGSIS